MRKGFSPQIHFNPHGDILSFATGSDACAEHEGGSTPMQKHLCSQAVTSDDPTLVKQIREGLPVSYPSLKERKTINQNLERIRFLTSTPGFGPKGAAIVFSRRGPYETDSLEAFKELRVYEGEEIAGAWCDDSFGFAVTGDKLVAKLKKFFDGLQAGDGLFAGTFLTEGEFSRDAGVCVARASLLRPEHKSAIGKAQLEFEQKTRLMARSRVDELHQVGRSPGDSRSRAPGHMWPAWKDGPDSEVVYHVNPNYETRKYFENAWTLSFEELRDWILAEKKYTFPKRTA